MKHESLKWVVVVSMLLLTVSFSSAQQKIRTLEESNPKYNFPNQPIAIVSRELRDKPFTDSQVLAGPDWLRNLTLSIKNVSNKTIKAFQINLNIEKQGKMQYDAGMDFYFPLPREPVIDASGKLTGEYQPLKVLKPGEIVKVKVNDNQLRILDVIKKQDVVDIQRVFISIRLVIFDDGSRWSLGLETQEDPNSPGSFVPVRPDTPEPSFSQRFSAWLRSVCFNF